MHRVFGVLVLWLALVSRALAAPAEAPHTAMRLLLSHDVARPGEAITAALEMISEPKWHTYWRNPGDAGLAPSIDWQLPPGISAGEIEWPVPHKMVLAHLFAYVYEGTTHLLIPLTISPDAPPGAVQIKGPVNWLECAEVCIPQSGSIEATLTIGNESKQSQHFETIQKAREHLPKSPPPFPVNASWSAGSSPEIRILTFEWRPNSPVSKPDFFPFESETWEVKPTTQVVEASPEKVRLTKEVELLETEAKWPVQLAGLILNDTSATHPVGYAATLELTDATAAAPALTGTVGGTADTTSLWVVLGLAFLGGLILNIMPCVLPVIALKILSFVRQSGEEPRRARQLGLVYALGVLTSFGILAGIVLAVQGAGGIASWGMQYQNPIFLVVMITLVTLIALNLFGVFEITLGGRTLGAASELAAREGSGGAFFNGVLATVLGTSCTAPFLAFAIGYALGQSPFMTVLIFLTMGVGLAFPYVVLTWNPALLRLLPKPGAWMEKFKVAMGFPMLATAIWLYGVAVKAHFGTNGAFWLALFLLLVGFSVWVFGAFIQHGARRKPLAALISVGTLALAIFFVLEQRLHWRSPVYAQSDSRALTSNSGVNWQKWSPDALAAARAAGHPVLVDFTADWCLNCQANKLTSIEIEPVEKKLQDIDGIAMLADFTRADPLIAQELKRFKRSAVPLVLVYPADPSEPPIVLPELLTPGIVLDALDKAASKPSATAAISQRTIPPGPIE